MCLYYTVTTPLNQQNQGSLTDNILVKEHYFGGIMSNLPENLKDLMEEAEIKAPALAKATGIDSSTILTLLRGDGLPYVDTLVTLADYFKCSTDYLLGLTDKLDNAEFKQRPPFPEQLTFLLEHFKITKYRLEKQTGLSEKTVNRWHNGKTQPTVESLIRLATYFNCSVDFILGREN